MNVELMLRGASGLGALCYLVGMLYFGYALMRVRSRRPEMVFFWAIVVHAAGLVLMAVASLVMRLLADRMMDWGGRGLDWIGVIPSILEGGVLLSSLVGAVALVVISRRSAWR